MPLSSFRPIRLLLVIALIGAAGSVAVSAQPLEPATPGGACFDVVRSPSGDALGSFLVNRCTGKTWILAGTRTRHGARAAYRWVPIAAGGPENGAVASETAPLRASAPINPNNDKCFTFQGRRFCE
jgi:hypothetical protein